MINLILKKISNWFFADITPDRPAILRIAFGFLAFLTFVSLWPDASFHFSDQGWLPRSAKFLTFSHLHQWTPLFWSGEVLWVQTFFIISMFISLMVIVGLATRLMVPLLWLAFLAIKARNFIVTDGADWMIQTVLMFLIFMKSGQAWSLDSYFKKNKESVVKTCPGWPIRMLQMQILLVYFVAGTTKLLGAQWWDGSAVSVLLMSRNYARWDLSWVAHFPFLIFLSKVITWTIPIWEILFAFLMCLRRIRLWVLAFGIVVHLSIAVFLKISFFSYAMLAAYTVFLPSYFAIKKSRD